jgi:putative endonuclease
MVYTVYILYSPTIDRYYIGHTDNIERRLHEHNTGQTRFTSIRGKPWNLLYSELYETRSLAMSREKEIKAKKSRKYIEWLISH